MEKRALPPSRSLNNCSFSDWRLRSSRCSREDYVKGSVSERRFPPSHSPPRSHTRRSQGASEPRFPPSSKERITLPCELRSVSKPLRSGELRDEVKAQGIRASLRTRAQRRVY